MTLISRSILTKNFIKIEALCMPKFKLTTTIEKIETWEYIVELTPEEVENLPKKEDGTIDHNSEEFKDLLVRRMYETDYSDGFDVELIDTDKSIQGEQFVSAELIQ